MTLVKFLSLIILTALLFSLGCTAKPQTYTGTLTTKMCAAGHHAAGMSVADCVRVCRKEGSSYALATTGKVYELKGDVAGLDNYAGTTVSVFGPRRGSMIEVTSAGPPTS